MIERGVELVEKHRLLRNGSADLHGMLPIVQSHADDFFRPRHHWAVFDRLFLEECFLRSRRLVRRIHESIQAGAILILKQIVDRRWRVHAQNLRRFYYIQDPFVGLHAQAVIGSAARVLQNVQQGESARHAACLGRARLGFCNGSRQPLRRRQGANRTRGLDKSPAILLH